jgi:hypothetical protein
MAKVTKSTGGAWLDKKALKTGDVIKIVSEAMDEEGQNGTQLVALVRVKGWTGEAQKLSINSPSKNALIDVFGDDTKNWQGQLLTAHIEKTMIAGKRGIALYLIPEGYELTEDQAGYLVIVKEGDDQPAPEDDGNQDEGIDDSVPF